MSAKVSKFLLDILESINAIEMHLRHVNTLHDYSKSLLISDAVERRLAIIGEALNKCLKEEPDFIISNTKKIIGLRHIINHYLIM